MPSKPIPVATAHIADDGAEPNVDFLNSVPVGDAPKSTIGVRKIQSRKPGMGARKPGGLGATKVKTNFDEIEQKAAMIGQMKETPAVIEKKLTADEEADAITSVRLAYQDLSMQRQKAEDKLKGMDPNKAKQMERLGMGFANRSSAVSHSMLSDMKVIDQDQAPLNMKSSSSYKNDNNNSSKSDFFDDYSSNSMYSSNSSNSNSKTDFRDAMMMGFEPIESKQNITTMFSSTMEEKRVADRQPTSSTSTSSSFGRNRDKDSKVTSPTNSYDSDSIQKKFSGAKGISSDQFFGNDSQAFERNNSNNASKFQGSTSISSDQYFGNETSQRRELSTFN